MSGRTPRRRASTRRRVVASASGKGGEDPAYDPQPIDRKRAAKHLKAFAKGCTHWTARARRWWLGVALSCLKRNDIKTLFQLMDRSVSETHICDARLMAHIDFFRKSYQQSKYFREAGEWRHYDRRFFKREITASKKAKTLRRLLKAFCRMLQPTGIQAILMHGGLIGWAWNRRLLPWDHDIDLCLFLEDLYALNREYDDLSYDKTRFLFDINPNFTDRRSRNRRIDDHREPNKIDARFIDRKTGLYIDITALADNGAGRLVSKCPHRYGKPDLLPLRRDQVEGIEIAVPKNVRKILVREYGRDVLRRTEFHGYHFDARKKRWLKRKRRDLRSDERA